MEAFETYDHAGCTIELHYDEMAWESNGPREWSNLGVMLSFDPREWSADRSIREHYCESEEEFVEEYLEGSTHHLLLQYQDYGSSGQRLYVVDDFDIANGVIYDTPETRAECGTPDELIEECLRGEVADYDTFLQGENYGWVVRRDGEVIDSCWGYLGDDGLEMAKQDAEASAEHEARNHARLGVYESAH